MRVKPENFHLLRKYGFSKISSESWVKMNDNEHSMYIVVNEQGVICVNHVKGELSGYDIPLPDVLGQMWKDGMIDTQFNHHNVLIEAAKAVFRDRIKVEEYLNQYVMKFDARELVNTFLHYILKNNIFVDSYIQTRYDLHKRSDNQYVVYLLSDTDQIRYAYLAQYRETIDDLIKKHDNEEDLIVTRVNDKNKEVVMYLKLNGEIVYEIL